MKNFNTAVAQVFFVEGGYSNHPQDHGGKTKYGITEKTLKAWLKEYPEVNYVNIHDLNRGQAEVIYQEMYWEKIRGDELPRGVGLMVFDSAVHAGPTQAIKWLQRATGCKTDGLFGPKTLLAANRTNRSSSAQEPLEIIKTISEYRLMMARKNDTFARGWFNRVIHILSVSVEEVLVGTRNTMARSGATSGPGTKPLRLPSTQGMQQRF